MEFTISSKFMRGVASKLIAKILKTKTGYDVNVDLKELEVKTVDGRVQLHTEIDADIDKDEFKRILSTIFGKKTES